MTSQISGRRENYQTSLEIFTRATAEVDNLIKSFREEGLTLFSSSELRATSRNLYLAYDSLNPTQKITNGLKHGAYQLKITFVKMYLQGVAERN